jgi:hypothetical protein
VKEQASMDALSAEIKAGCKLKRAKAELPK